MVRKVRDRQKVQVVIAESSKKSQYRVMVDQENVDAAPDSATAGDSAATIRATSAPQVCLTSARETEQEIHTPALEEPYIQAGLDISNYAKLLELNFEFEDDRVRCPVVVVRESDEIWFDQATLDVTFGTAKSRPMMMTSTDIKCDILSKMQDKPINSICKDACNGVLVGLKNAECLVLISLTDTAKRLEEIEHGSERHSDTVALRRCLGLLAGLGPYLHSGEDGVIYGWKTPIVSGNSQRVTKSQVRVSEPMWRGLFQGHRDLMAPSLLQRVFQSRSRRRPRQEEATVPSGKTPRYIASLATKSHGSNALKVVRNEEPIPTEAEEVMEKLTAKLEQRRSCMGDTLCDTLVSFVAKYRKTVNNDVFIQDLGELCILNAPEEVLKRSIGEFIEAPECEALSKEFNGIH